MTTVYYKVKTESFLLKTQTKLKGEFVRRGKYFDGDEQSRDVFKITLRRVDRRVSFQFGQSIAETGNPPSAYDVLACLTKSDPGTFENFCSDYGYDTDSLKALKTYKAVCAEWKKVQHIWTAAEIEALQEIQ